MARFRLWWYALIVAVAIMGSAWIYLTRMPPEPGDALNQAAHVNFRAPPLALPLLSGGKATLGDLRGQVVLVNFWATWCVPCRTEMPEIQALPISATATIRAYHHRRNRAIYGEL
jgi:thiol:disulfide interchange protein